MEKEYNTAFIILYTWDSTDDWIGKFPANPDQWYHTDYLNAPPNIYYSRDAAEKAAKDEALYGYKIVCIAGKEKARKVNVCGTNGVPYSKELQESIQRINEDLDSKPVLFFGKERRKSFDNEFGEDKIKLAHKLIGENSEQIAEVLKNQSTNTETP